MCFFFFIHPATTEIYTLSLHDALPIFLLAKEAIAQRACRRAEVHVLFLTMFPESNLTRLRSEEHTSELQSRQYLVCRLLLEKKKSKIYSTTSRTSTTNEAYE